ncbi:helix-turn-helix domain-containing protein [Kocuria salina]|uniref:helix-turn-helix domain-containing protein n=1 Tax=Kocuria salina TaxID=1929416 RepID=UPI001592AFFD|nr:helix-turn-helix domain-containing protein [Kocuria salina]NVC24072.1 helix-turn-helix domain-containing protein [Kocuria salina]
MAKSPELEKLYTVAQVAELGLIPYHADTIRQLCRKGPALGGLRTVRPGTNKAAKYLIPASAIEEWKKRNEYSPWAR